MLRRGAGSLLGLCVFFAGLATASAQTAFVYLHQAWRYDVSGTEPPATWTTTNFDDSAWQNGEAPFGYGPGLNPATKIEAPIKTFYLRASFTLNAPADVNALALEAAFAQGAVVYLNGSEVFRDAMPPGATSYDLAALPHTPSALEKFDLSAATSSLVSGKNVLAVEVHQSDPPDPTFFWGGRLLYDSVSLRVTRGPYLQLVTPTSAVVRWRTNRPSDSRVSYGVAPDSSAQNAADAAPTSEHEITLKGLTPATRYAYAVGSQNGALAGGDDAHVFATAPESGSSAPFRAWVLGDSGTQDDTARAVRDAYYANVGSGVTDLWLMLGDNGYPDGDDVNYQYGIFENMYEAMLAKAALWPTYGNHDWGNGINDAAAQAGPYFEMHTLPKAAEAGGKPSGTEAYYSFDYANVHFVSLDTIELKTPEQIDWLKADLGSTQQTFIVGFFHVPPYSKGSHDSDQPGAEFARQALAQTLEDFGADLVLSGHSHDYERSILIDGQYQTSDEFVADPAKFTKNGGDGRVDGDGAYQKPAARAPHQGTVYVVSGASGGREGGFALNHPIMLELEDPNTHEIKHGLDVPGSLVLEVAGTRLDARYVDLDGNVLDHFTISKGELAGGSGGSSATHPGSDSDSGGCGCHGSASIPSAPWLLALWALGMGLSVRRGKRRGKSGPPTHKIVN